MKRLALALVLALAAAAAQTNPSAPAPFDPAWLEGAEEILYAGPASHIPEPLLSAEGARLFFLIDLGNLADDEEAQRALLALLEAGYPVVAIYSNPPLEPEVIIPGKGVAQLAPQGWRFLDYPELAQAKLDEFAPVLTKAPRLTLELFEQVRRQPPPEMGGGGPS